MHLFNPANMQKSLKWYDRKFAFMPVVCNGERVWLKHYYVRYETVVITYSTPRFGNPGYSGTVKSCITEADYIVDKLTEGF